jgi:hypothetical protein
MSPAPRLPKTIHVSRDTKRPFVILRAVSEYRTNEGRTS